MRRADRVVGVVAGTRCPSPAPVSTRRRGRAGRARAPRRRQGDAVLVGLDLLDDADLHQASNLSLSRTPAKRAGRRRCTFVTSVTPVQLSSLRSQREELVPPAAAQPSGSQASDGGGRGPRRSRQEAADRRRRGFAGCAPSSRRVPRRGEPAAGSRGSRRRASGAAAPVADALGDGALDIGCANGHLLEASSAVAHRVEPYGLDRASVAQLARERLPRADDLRACLAWEPPAATLRPHELVYVPQERRRIVQRLTTSSWPDGRLIVCGYGSRAAAGRRSRDELSPLGFDDEVEARRPTAAGRSSGSPSRG